MESKFQVNEQFTRRWKKFKSDKPLVKCVTDMTEVKCLDGKLYVSAVFDCFDTAVLGLAIDTRRNIT